ncbi:MAG: type II toxin-antitoxin system PemK/MazF family toxin [Frankia sp.]
MRPIHLARLDEVRPVLVLTRDVVRRYLTNVTIAPITSTTRGLSTEVPVGARNGLDHDSVVSCDDITTIPARQLRQQVGYLLPAQEHALTEAIVAAFDLD